MEIAGLAWNPRCGGSKAPVFAWGLISLTGNSAQDAGSSFEEALARARSIVESASDESPRKLRGLDIEHYEVVVDVKASFVQGRTRVRFRTLPQEVTGASSHGMDSVSLCLNAEDLTIEKVEDTSGSAAPFVHENGGLVIEPGAQGVDSSREVVVRHSTNLGPVSSPHSRTDGFGGKLAPSFVAGTRRWFPCLDEPGERARFDVHITVDPGLRTVSSGTLVESTTSDDGRRTDHWRCPMEISAKDVALYVGEFEAVDLGRLRDVSLIGEARPDLGPLVLPTLRTTGIMMDTFEQLVGVPYPYPSYRQVFLTLLPEVDQVSAALAAWNETELAAPPMRADHDLALDRQIARKLARQWWGGLLSPATQQDAWILEGFAAYLDLLCLERHRGPREFLAALLEVQDSPGVVGHDGAAFLHLLRHVMGDETFLRALRESTAALKGRSVGVLDVQAEIERSSGLDLSTCFEEWSLAPAPPEVELSWRFHPEKEELVLVASQVQNAQAFHLPLRVTVVADDQRRVIDFPLSERVTRKTLPCKKSPVFVRFNEANAVPGIIRARQPSISWQAQALFDEDPTGRVQAVRALAGDNGSVRSKADPEEHYRTEAVLVLALIEDDWFKVRCAAAQAIAGLSTQGGAVALSAALNDEDARVRAIAATCLTKVTTDDSSVAKLLQRFALERDLTVQAQILRAVGAARRPEHGPMLSSIADSTTRAIAVRAAALSALAQIAPDEALGKLRKWLEEGAPPALKQPATELLGELCGNHESAESMLLSMLDSPDPQVELRAVQTLQDQGSARAIHALVEKHDRSTLLALRKAIRSALRSILARQG